MRTSLGVVFAVGDGTVPEGVDIAEMEGRIAGLTATWQLGRLTQSDWEHQVAAYQAKLASLRKFRRTVDSLFRLGKETDSLLSEDTLICRCEEVTLAEVMTAIREGATDLNTLKGWTRAGMGRCQGRNCEPSLAYLLHRKLNTDWQTICGFTPRFPVKPIPFAVMVKEEVT
jgi:NAD(P)H-nitrite reductase large subunit